MCGRIDVCNWQRGGIGKNGSFISEMEGGTKNGAVSARTDTADTGTDAVCDGTAGAGDDRVSCLRKRDQQERGRKKFICLL